MKMYPYQEEGARFLVNNASAYLADEMGLGKTVQALHAASVTANVNPDDGLAPCVICPASVIPVWQEHMHKLGIPGAVVSYNKMDTVPDHAEFFIFDEAHFLKNPQAKRTKQALELAERAARVWMLSGTPMPNGPHELFTAVQMLRPDLLKPEWNTYTKWLQYFCVYEVTQYGFRVLGSKNKDVLRSLVRRFLKRRRTREVLHDLPPLRTDYVRIGAGSSRIPSEFGPTTEETARMLTDAPMSDPHVSRLRRRLGEWKARIIAKELVQELTDDPHKTLAVYAHHTTVLDALEEELEYFGTVRIDGSTKDRVLPVNMFNAGRLVSRVFLGQNQAAGVGITLTGTSDIVLVEPSWSPEDNMQIIKRIHRIGQTEACRARIVAVADSLDDAICGVLARKTKMIADTLD